MSSFKMRPHPRSKVLELFRERDSIDLDPVYQRISGVWDDRKKRLLIDSIINGFRIPNLYFHELVPPQEKDGHQYRYAIIDGKQRLLAIWRFMEDELSLPNEFKLFDDPSLEAGGLTYSDLASSPEHTHLRARFDRTELPIILMETSDFELVEMLFSRLNEAVPLTAPEYRNTLGGPMPPALRMLEKHNFFQGCLPFETGRYRFLDLAAKLLFILHHGRFVSTKKLELDEFVRDFRQRSEEDEESTQRSVDKMMSRAGTLLDRTDQFFDEDDPLLSSVGWITLFFQLFRLMEGRRKPKELTRELFVSFTDRLSETRAILKSITKGEPVRKKPVPELQQFVNLGQSSNDGAAILGRYRIVRAYFAKEFGVELPEPRE